MNKLINGTNRYFINDSGYCFKISRRLNIEQVIPLNIIQGIPKVKIENRKLNMVNLMIEYFIGEIPENSTIKFKIIDGLIPLSKIAIVRHNQISSEDDKLIFDYSCSKKASSSNNRASHKTKIDKYDVLNCLKISNFKCHYCGDKIKSRNWHLDHVYPLSKGGENSKNNIIPSCRACNLMKGDMHVNQFLYQCNKILNNFK